MRSSNNARQQRGSTASEDCGRRCSKPLLPSLPVLICRVGERFPSPRPCSSLLCDPRVPPSADAARGKPRPYKISVGRHCWNPAGSGEAAVGAGRFASWDCIVNWKYIDGEESSRASRMESAPVSWAPANPSSSRSVDVNSRPADPCLLE